MLRNVVASNPNSYRPPHDRESFPQSAAKLCVLPSSSLDFISGILIRSNKSCAKKINEFTLKTFLLELVRKTPEQFVFRFFYFRRDISNSFKVRFEFGLAGTSKGGFLILLLIRGLKKNGHKMKYFYCPIVSNLAYKGTFPQNRFDDHLRIKIRDWHFDLRRNGNICHLTVLFWSCNSPAQVLQNCRWFLKSSNQHIIYF